MFLSKNEDFTLREICFPQLLQYLHTTGTKIV